MDLHGLRKTASTFLNAHSTEYSFDIDDIERVLHHKTDANRVRAIYNKYDYLKEHYQLLAFYNAYIERESEAITELNVYRKVDGRYEAAQGYHDDRVMVRAIGLYIHENMPPVTTIEPNRKFNLDRPLGESTI